MPALIGSWIASHCPRAKRPRQFAATKVSGRSTSTGNLTNSAESQTELCDPSQSATNDACPKCVKFFAARWVISVSICAVSVSKARFMGVLMARSARMAAARPKVQDAIVGSREEEREVETKVGDLVAGAF
jgi:hypothetical protein